MIAKTTIIRDEVIRGEMPRHDLTQVFSDMAVALQWYVVYNGTEPVALATSRSAETGVGKKDVLLVVCDCKKGHTHNLHAASLLARFIFDAYNAREGKFVPNGVEPAKAERTDIARCLADAIGEGLRRLYKGEAVALSASAAPVPPAAAGDALKGATASVIAAVIHHDKLLVARYGSGRLYLLRGGMLQNLTDESFADAAHADPFEPDLGQLDLVGEDRILLCTELADVVLVMLLSSCTRRWLLAASLRNKSASFSFSEAISRCTCSTYLWIDCIDTQLRSSPCKVDYAPNGLAYQRRRHPAAL